MKWFDAKSLAAGIIIGTLGITTVFAATGIQSAVLSETKVTLNGAPLPLEKPLISVTMENEQEASLYVPVDELLEQLGYTVNYDGTKNTVDLISGTNRLDTAVGGAASAGDVVIGLTNNASQTNIAESGAFQADDNQTLILNITSNIKGGTVDLFLFAPSGKEQRITIGAENRIEEIALEKGIWQYNCSGIFKDGGEISIVGTIK